MRRTGSNAVLMKSTDQHCNAVLVAQPSGRMTAYMRCKSVDSPAVLTHLTQQHVARGRVNVLPHGIAAGHHVPVLELHALGALRAQLARNNHLAALGTCAQEPTGDKKGRPPRTSGLLGNKKCTATKRCTHRSPSRSAARHSRHGAQPSRPAACSAWTPPVPRRTSHGWQPGGELKGGGSTGQDVGNP